MAENPTENAKKSLKKAENRLLSMIKNYLVELHGYPSERYIQPFFYGLLKDFGLICEKIILYGIVDFFFLLGLMYVFPYFRVHFYLGTSIVEMIYAVLSLGLIMVSIKEFYLWLWRKK